jgi:hypothetical protein
MASEHLLVEQMLILKMPLEQTSFVQMSQIRIMSMSVGINPNGTIVIRVKVGAPVFTVPYFL